MLSVNWVTLLILLLALVLIRLAVNGRYGQAWGGLTSIPLTPAQAQAQAQQQSAANLSLLSRIG